MTLVVIIVLFLALFALAFLSKRRFGTLGLALAAGALLADQLSREVARYFDKLDVPVEPLSSLTAARVVLILLPAIVLLMSGPSYSSKRTAFFGALAFGLMATLLVLGPLTTSLPIEGAVRPMLDFVAANQSLLLACAVTAAVVDSWLTHNLKSSRKKHSKEY